ncbi:drug resistance transporter, EmrB/QacA subfamily [Sanguibacter gelidistatuariae]|uniref:Drug resistance transporter, EmrB/QacA subfamily n=1 Tax=Sanguibacter gelidistatuariae TaxID=1814289 RepID=A0A1G6GVK3_9MICO|nr:MFS transporter [Sanguibacter gelidistatuariae]SDB86047.1 drug resistance transporter, EmrB/QacA subfamily [Sanguibacter gelidistatuariae]
MATGARHRTGVAPGDLKIWWILAVLVTAQLMVVLDATIVNIALPTAQKDLGMPADMRQWVVTAYSLAFGGLLIIGGRIGDRVGRRTTFLIGVVGFAVASTMGGLAPTYHVLIAARGLQGAFGALMAPAALSLVTVTFEGLPTRPKAFGIWGAASGAGGAIGLLLGGFLTEYLTWRWCLLVNIVFAVIAFVGAVVLLPRTLPDHDVSVNPLSAVLIAGGLFGIVYGLSHAETAGWSDPATLVLLIGGVVLVAIFLMLQRTLTSPLLPLRVLSNRFRGGALTAVLFAGSGLFGVFLFLTYYLQDTLGFTAMRTGLAFLPMVAVLATTSALVGAFFLVRIGPRRLVGTGMVIGAFALALMTRFDDSTTYFPGVLVPLLFAGLGVGMLFASALGTATLGLRDDDAGVGSSLVNTSQQVGGAIGIALLSTMAASATASHLTTLMTDLKLTSPTSAVTSQAALAGYHTAFWWSAGIFLFGAVLCTLIFPPGPAPRSVRADVSTAAPAAPAD